MYLNRWQRAGVVASVLWGIGGGIWGLTIGARESDWIFRQQVNCWEAASDRPIPPFKGSPGSPEWRREMDEVLLEKRRMHDSCDREFESQWSEHPHWGNRLIGAGAVGLGPILLGWVAAYIVV